MLQGQFLGVVSHSSRTRAGTGRQRVDDAWNESAEGMEASVDVLLGIPALSSARVGKVELERDLQLPSRCFKWELD